MKKTAKSESAISQDFDQATEDFAALTRDLTTLIEKMKAIAVGSSNEAVCKTVEELRTEAQALFEKVAAKGQQSSKAVGRQIEARPVLSLLVVFAVGFCASRLLSR
ncbi:hypothetical protein [Limibacillus sp. MBR-115]|jgi:ElaB/YqjD/DUF883 family membrane-anchored ribosome-binding protein|uniref:hypothetical protein n=1 Tax=Limibacillus sp. MBR-115 TaxID=3156465 RepID=UPI0033952775